ncbi:hypothetical protein CGCF415_v009072 [Colletotrichum fructicola]|uniref:Uncharacterized protein n=1 Tax=Colletotrichum fructicola (strain Nara gc5) TaxID=1213859 RepID=L2FBK9_COLFN|nr:hypothetical protein CGGC5_v001760 [Colletotrichum fructicola Nara gc5]KAF4881902.1 hypothetical protein CGCFRS4_v015095 [Colletotrichum fructicola]KAF4903463.1 hypothetical protein CGCF415_v009072 [Colletotrichum fructicola]
MACYRIYTPTTPRRSCLKNKALTSRKYWGTESGGLFYHESREAEEGVPRTRYLEDMRNWQVTEYERRVTAEDANRRYFQSSRSHPRERKPSAVRFFGETTFIYNPRKSIREINMAGYELVGVFTSRMTEDEVMKTRRRLYKRPEDF